MIIILILIVFLLLFILFRKREPYELVTLCYDVCRVDCLEKGYDHEICEDSEDKLMKECISRMVAFAGPIPSSAHAFPPTLETS